MTGYNDLRKFPAIMMRAAAMVTLMALQWESCGLRLICGPVKFANSTDDVTILGKIIMLIDRKWNR